MIFFSVQGWIVAEWLFSVWLAGWLAGARPCYYGNSLLLTGSLRALLSAWQVSLQKVVPPTVFGPRRPPHESPPCFVSCAELNREGPGLHFAQGGGDLRKAQAVKSPRSAASFNLKTDFTTKKANGGEGLRKMGASRAKGGGVEGRGRTRGERPHSPFLFFFAGRERRPGSGGPAAEGRPGEKLAEERTWRAAVVRAGRSKAGGTLGRWKWKSSVAPAGSSKTGNNKGIIIINNNN